MKYAITANSSQAPCLPPTGISQRPHGTSRTNPQPVLFGRSQNLGGELVSSAAGDFGRRRPAAAPRRATPIPAPANLAPQMADLVFYNVCA